MYPQLLAKWITSQSLSWRSCQFKSHTVVLSILLTLVFLHKTPECNTVNTGNVIQWRRERECRIQIFYILSGLNPQDVQSSLSLLPRSDTKISQTWASSVSFVCSLLVFPGDCTLIFAFMWFVIGWTTWYTFLPWL